MNYTVCLDLFIDNDNVMSELEITECLKEMLNSTAIEVNNIKLLKVNN